MKFSVSPSRPSFTLIEVIAVIAIISLLSTAAALAIRQPIRSAQRDYALAAIQWLDSVARERARSESGLHLDFDQTTHTAILLDHLDRPVAPSVSLSRGNAFVEILGLGRPTGGPYHVTYDRFGVSQSFALCVADHNAPGKWLLIVGLTGQGYLYDDPIQPRKIISMQRAYSR